MNYEIFVFYLLFPWAGVAILVFLTLQWVSAPYGRHTRGGWGLMIDNRVGWIAMEAVSPLVLFYFFWQGSQPKTVVLWFFVGLWLLHYFNRSIVFPLRTRTQGKKMPLMIALMAIFFNSINGFTNGYYLGNLSGEYPLTWFYNGQFIIGILLFISGLWINWQADEILLNLRQPQETGYKIPQGGFYQYVSCPNYLGEMIEWLGFAILTASPAAWVFWLWTIANLLPRALAHHAWYQQTFADYPPQRKAVIPFIW
jgi:3-oxo-5-alpha-steroid 4-dehydrogenase 1